MTDGVDVFDRAARKEDSEFHIVIRLFTDCLIEVIYAIPFIGQMHGVSSRYLPDPTPRMREPLRLRQVTLAAPQRFFSLFALSDIRDRSHELEAARVVLG